MFHLALWRDTCDTCDTASETLEPSLSKFRLFGRWRVSRVEWRAPRPVQSITQATSSGPAIENATATPPPPPPHFQTAHQERHSHYASDDFTPAVKRSVLLCCVSSRTTITLRSTHPLSSHRHSLQACRAIATSSPFPFVVPTICSSPTQSNHTSQQNTTNTQTPSLATWRSSTSCAKMLLPLLSHMRVAYESCRHMLPS